MERIQLYRVKRKYVKFIMIFGLLVFTFGFVLLIYTFFEGFNTELMGGDWIYIIHICQGALFIYLGCSQLRTNRYFIEWDSEKIRYQLPDNKETTEIRLRDIKSVSMDLLNIRLYLINDDVKHIKLKDIHYNELNRIKKKFRDIGAASSG